MDHWLWKTLKLIGAASILIRGWREQSSRARERRQLESAQEKAKDLQEEIAWLHQRLRVSQANAS